MRGKKTNPIKKVLTILISLAFAAFFLWYATKGLDFKVIKESLSKANYWWVVFAGIFGLLAYWFRAVRWNLLLEPIGYSTSNLNALWSISFGYLMNLTIPRSGEVARATALYGVEKVPVSKSVGTIILERVIDLVCMVGFLLLAIIFKFDAIVSFYDYITTKKEVSIDKHTPTAFEKFLLSIGINDFDFFYLVLKILISILIIGIIYYFIKFKRIQLINFIKGIWEGIASISKLKQKGKFILYTIGIWVCYFFAAYLVCFALPETSDFTVADGFFIIVVGTLGMIVPASGGIGAFNLAMKYGFMALFLSMGKSAEVGGEVGLTYSFISLPLQIVIMLTTGLLSIPMLAKARNKLEAENELTTV